MQPRNISYNSKVPKLITTDGYIVLCSYVAMETSMVTKAQERKYQVTRGYQGRREVAHHCHNYKIRALVTNFHYK